MNDRPYDINEQAERGPREDPADFDCYDQVGGEGPSTMDRDKAQPSEADNLVQLEARRSPWIPRPLDNTAMKSYMECPRKYYYSMVRHKRSKGPERPALAYGSVWHTIMETHYKTGGDARAVVEAAHAAWKPHDSPEDHRTLERACMEYGKFIQTYGDFETEARNWGRTVGYPENPIVELPCEIWWPGAPHPYAGKIDRIFELNGLFYIEDHKSTSAMGPTYFKQFDPSNQMMGYDWLGGLLSGLPIAGVRINAHAVLKTTSKFERQTIPFSPQRLEEWAKNYGVWARRIERSHELLTLQSKKLNIDMDQVLLEAFPHNFEACAGKYGQCGYTDVCTYPAEMREDVLDGMDENPWNPLNPDGDET